MERASFEGLGGCPILTVSRCGGWIVGTAIPPHPALSPKEREKKPQATLLSMNRRGVEIPPHPALSPKEREKVTADLCKRVEESRLRQFILAQPIANRRHAEARRRRNQNGSASATAETRRAQRKQTTGNLCALRASAVKSAAGFTGPNSFVKKGTQPRSKKGTRERVPSPHGCMR